MQLFAPTISQDATAPGMVAHMSELVGTKPRRAISGLNNYSCRVLSAASITSLVSD
jgi:hypothetical protein